MTGSERVTSSVRVLSFAISIDGYSAGPNQDLENPLGVRGPELMEWFFHTRMWRQMHGHADGETGVDNGSPSRASTASAHGSSGATCSVPSAGRGPTTAGRAGGATSRRITCRCSC